MVVRLCQQLWGLSLRNFPVPPRFPKRTSRRFSRLCLAQGKNGEKAKRSLERHDQRVGEWIGRKPAQLSFTFRWPKQSKRSLQKMSEPTGRLALDCSRVCSTVFCLLSSTVL